jgi:hypothetical protein
VSAAPEITDEQKEMLRDYVRARRKAAEENVFIEKNKDAVLAIVRLLGGSAVYLNGRMYQGESISYDYPATIQNRQQKLTKDKKIMQLDGRARKIAKPCLMFEDLAKPIVK